MTPYDLEYLGKFPEDKIHDDVTVTFSPLCRNCEKFEDQHAAGKCFFEATSWDPMSQEELNRWYLDKHIQNLNVQWNKHSHVVTGTLSPTKVSVLK